MFLPESDVVHSRSFRPHSDRDELGIYFIYAQTIFIVVDFQLFRFTNVSTLNGGEFNPIPSGHWHAFKVNKASSKKGWQSSFPPNELQYPHNTITTTANKIVTFFISYLLIRKS
jgi:hypothetical protein